MQATRSSPRASSTTAARGRRQSWVGSLALGARPPRVSASGGAVARGRGGRRRAGPRGGRGGGAAPVAGGALVVARVDEHLGREDALVGPLDLGEREALAPLALPGALEHGVEAPVERDRVGAQ